MCHEEAQTSDLFSKQCPKSPATFSSAGVTEKLIDEQYQAVLLAKVISQQK